jgi:hypothetical protein
MNDETYARGRSQSRERIASSKRGATPAARIDYGFKAHHRDAATAEGNRERAVLLESLHSNPRSLQDRHGPPRPACSRKANRPVAPSPSTRANWRHTRRSPSMLLNLDETVTKE